MLRLALAPLLALVLTGTPHALLAQWQENFSDGDITHAPPWQGDISRWTTIPFGADHGLATKGLPRADTLVLATPSTQAFGYWSVTLHYRGGRLSNFNLARIYLTANTADLRVPSQGYYLQVGTNARDLRLYRSDPQAPGGRTLLVQSEANLLEQDADTLHLAITRSPQRLWTVTLNKNPLFSRFEPDGTTGSAYFGLWVKHTASRPESMVFDDISATPPPPGTSPTPPQPGDLIINEIHFAPEAPVPEFVEVYNPSSDTLDLRWITLSDASGPPQRLSEAPRLLMPASFATLTADSQALRTRFPRTDPLALSPWPSLNNGGDVLTLTYLDTILDQVSYDPNWGAASRSLERRDPEGPSDEGMNWGPSTHPEGATPGQRNTLYAPDHTPPLPTFVDHQKPQQLTVFFDEPLDTTAVPLTAFHVHGQHPNRVAIRDGRTTLLLTFRDPLQGTTLTLAGVADLKGNRLPLTDFPIAWSPSPGALQFNEIMYAPLADESDGVIDQPEYVELYNAGARLLSLRSLYWTKVPDETGDADTLHFDPIFAALAPGRFAVIFAQPLQMPHEALFAQSTLSLAFPFPYQQWGTLLLPVAAQSLSLRNGGDLLRLHRADGTVLDAVQYTPMWHHPGVVDATGRSLEKYQPDADSQEASHWSTSLHPDGGTPGQVNSLYEKPQPYPSRKGLVVTPSPFSPDQDGHADVASIQYVLGLTEATIRARIFDASGRRVRTLTQGALATRTGTLIWDGLDDHRAALPIGIYVVHLEAVAPAEGRVEAYKTTVVLARPLR